MSSWEAALVVREGYCGHELRQWDGTEQRRPSPRLNWQDLVLS